MSLRHSVERVIIAILTRVSPFRFVAILVLALIWTLVYLIASVGPASPVISDWLYIYRGMF